MSEPVLCWQRGHVDLLELNASSWKISSEPFNDLDLLYLVYPSFEDLTRSSLILKRNTFAGWQDSSRVKVLSLHTANSDFLQDTTGFSKHCWE